MRAEGNGINASHDITINISEDGSARVVHQIKLMNDSNLVVNAYTIKTPMNWSSVGLKRSGGGATISVTKGNAEIKLTNKPLLPGQETTLELTYDLKNAVSPFHGLLRFNLPEFGFGEVVESFSLKINYPKSYPDLVYYSQGNTEQTTGSLISTNYKKPLQIIWGKELRLNIKETLKLGTNLLTREIVNLPADYSEQDTTYMSLSSDAQLASELNGNLWAIPPEGELEYHVIVTRKQNNELSFDEGWPQYPSLSLPGELAYLHDADRLTGSSEQGLHTSIQSVHQYLIENFTPSYQRTVLSRDELRKLSSKALLKEEEVGPIEVALLAEGYLHQLGIKAAVAYGYVYGMELAGFDSTLPHVWVEVNADGKLIIIDPYLESLTGSDFYDVTPLTRVKFGIWDPSHLEDNVLGILSSNLRTRPELSQELAIKEQSLSYLVSGSFPESAKTLSFYGGRLTIENKSLHILRIDKIIWEGIDLSRQAMAINDKLHRAIGPNRKEEVALPKLMSPRIVWDGYMSHTIQVVPHGELFSPNSISYRILYTPNTNLILYALGISIGAILLFVVYKNIYWKGKI